MRYMLDTDICIYAINERPPRVLRALRDHPAAGLGVSSITASELHYGVARTGSTRNAEALGRFLSSLEVADFDAAASEVAGQLRAWLAERGTPIGAVRRIDCGACAIARRHAGNQQLARIWARSWPEAR